MQSAYYGEPEAETMVCEKSNELGKAESSNNKESEMLQQYLRAMSELRSVKNRSLERKKFFDGVRSDFLIDQLLESTLKKKEEALEKEYEALRKKLNIDERLEDLLKDFEVEKLEFNSSDEEFEKYDYELDYLENEILLQNEADSKTFESIYGFQEKVDDDEIQGE